MDSAVTIRSEDFNHPDSVALRAEMVAELHAVYGFDSEPGAKPTAADMPIFLMARNSDGGAVGCGGLRRLDETTVEIKRIFVRPGARGGGSHV